MLSDRENRMLEYIMASDVSDEIKKRALLLFQSFIPFLKEVPDCVAIDDSFMFALDIGELHFEIEIEPNLNTEIFSFNRGTNFAANWVIKLESFSEGDIPFLKND